MTGTFFDDVHVSASIGTLISGLGPGVNTISMVNDNEFLIEWVRIGWITYRYLP